MKTFVVLLTLLAASFAAAPASAVACLGPSGTAVVCPQVAVAASGTDTALAVSLAGCAVGVGCFEAGAVSACFTDVLSDGALAEQACLAQAECAALDLACPPPRPPLPCPPGSTLRGWAIWVAPNGTTTITPDCAYY